MIQFISGLIVGLIVAQLLLLKNIKEKLTKITDKVDDIIPQKAQFIDPITPEEKFKNAENITQILDA